ncbi:MAG: hypothetical protein K0S49_50 [Microbacterium sp.]|jgi:hypothetical protein|nr:hypothetical protein [Microbacterium sp.]
MSRSECPFEVGLHRSSASSPSGVVAASSLPSEAAIPSGAPAASPSAAQAGAPDNGPRS